MEKLGATLASFVNAGKFVDYGGSAGFKKTNAVKRPKYGKKRNGKCTELLWSSIEMLYVSGEFLSGIEFGSNRKLA